MLGTGSEKEFDQDKLLCWEDLAIKAEVRNGRQVRILIMKMSKAMRTLIDQIVENPETQSCICPYRAF